MFRVFYDYKDIRFTSMLRKVWFLSEDEVDWFPSYFCLTAANRKSYLIGDNYV